MSRRAATQTVLCDAGDDDVRWSLTTDGHLDRCALSTFDSYSSRTLLLSSHHNHTRASRAHRRRCGAQVSWRWLRSRWQCSPTTSASRSHILSRPDAHARRKTDARRPPGDDRIVSPTTTRFSGSCNALRSRRPLRRTALPPRPQSPSSTRIYLSGAWRTLTPTLTPALTPKLTPTPTPTRTALTAAHVRRARVRSCFLGSVRFGFG